MTSSGQPEHRLHQCDAGRDRLAGELGKLSDVALGALEQLWNRDLSDHDPDGPLPSVDPVVGENTISRGRADASDGFILVPHITPGGLDPFVDQVVPLLQERGVFRTDYTGTTLRDHLGLAPLHRSAVTGVAGVAGVAS